MGELRFAYDSAAWNCAHSIQIRTPAQTFVAKGMKTLKTEWHQPQDMEPTLCNAAETPRRLATSALPRPCDPSGLHGNDTGAEIRKRSPPAKSISVRPALNSGENTVVIGVIAHPLNRLSALDYSFTKKTARATIVRKGCVGKISSIAARYRPVWGVGTLFSLRSVVELSKRSRGCAITSMIAVK